MLISLFSCYVLGDPIEFSLTKIKLSSRVLEGGGGRADINDVKMTLGLTLLNGEVLIISATFYEHYCQHSAVAQYRKFSP